MRKSIGALLALLIIGIMFTAGCTPAKPTLLIYGDSLTAQSINQVHYFYDGKYNVQITGWYGTAPCDFAPKALADRNTFHPARVVLAFTGNANTCVANDKKFFGDAGVLRNYDFNVRLLTQAFHGIPMTIVLPPAMHNSTAPYEMNGNPLLIAQYRTECAEFGLTCSNKADDWLTPGHLFRSSGPKLGDWGKTVVYRQNDGVHLTPDGAAYYGLALGS